MILNQKQIKELAKATKPLLALLRSYHPHVTIIATSEGAELVEGLAVVVPKERHAKAK